MVLDASKTNPAGKCKSFTDFSANENGFGCIQNQSLDKCKQISQYKADENGFGCVQNQPASKCKSIYRDVQNYPREMQTNSLILAKDPQTNENKSVDVSAFENCFRCVQNQSLDKCKQISQFKAHENGFGWVENQPASKCKSIDRYVQNYRREMQTNWLILAKNPQKNENKSADFSAFENGFRCVQNQSLDKCKQISQFKAHENGFGCVQNQPASKCKSIYRDVQNYPSEMQTNSLILAKDPQTNENKSVDVSAFENCFRCVQNQSLDKCKQISQFKAHENGFGCVQNQPASKCKSIYRDVQNYPREMQTNSLILAKDPQTNENKSVDVSAFENCFRCVQNQSLDKCRQIGQFKAHENGFGCVQNQSAAKCKSIDRF